MEQEKQTTTESGNHEVLLAQWQTCVEMANAVSERRDTMNNLFVTLNLAIVAAITFIWNMKTVLLLLSGIAVCGVWFLFIRNFRELNRAKFNVINKMEASLPVQAFSDEWKLLEGSKKYIEGTKLERLMPAVFCIVYVVALVVVIAMEISGCKA